MSMCMILYECGLWRCRCNYIWVSMCVHINVFSNVSVSICIYVQACIVNVPTWHVGRRVCLCTCEYVTVDACEHLCVYMCIYMSVCFVIVSMCRCTDVWLCECAHMQMWVNMCVGCEAACICTCYECKWIFLCIDLCECVCCMCAWVCVHECTCTCVYLCVFLL